MTGVWETAASLTPRTPPLPLGRLCDCTSFLRPSGTDHPSDLGFYKNRAFSHTRKAGLGIARPANCLFDFCVLNRSSAFLQERYVFHPHNLLSNIRLQKQNMTMVREVFVLRL